MTSLLMLLTLLLTGCAKDLSAGGAVELPPEQTPPAEPSDVVLVDEPPWFATFRIVDGGETGNLVLAANGGGAGEVFTLSIDGTELNFAPRDGQLINVYFDAVLETYPARFAGVSAVELTENPADDRCGLYLGMLEDLWERDSALNDDIAYLGFDLSELTDLSEAEKSALIWKFSNDHGAQSLTGTYQELVEWGYIDGEALYWEDGVLISVTGSAEEGFDAQKWRSGLGAYGFADCTARMAEDGGWSYTIGAEFIS